MSKKKVAHLILSVPPKKAAEILKELNENEVLGVGEAMLRYAVVDNKENTQTEEKEQAFIKISGKKTALEIVKSLYKITFGTKKAQDLVKKLLRRQIVHRLSFFNVHKNSDILECIKNESPTVISIILSSMHSDKASQILLFLPFDMRVSVMKAIAKQSTPDEGVIEIIEKNMSQKLHNLTAVEKESTGGVKSLSHILKHMDSKAQDAILNNIDDSELKEKLRNKIEAWDVFEKVQKKYLDELISNYRTEALASLIKVYGEEAKSAIFLGLSRRNKVLVEEEIELYNHKKKAPRGNTEEIKQDLFNKVKQILAEHPQPTEEESEEYV